MNFTSLVEHLVRLVVNEPEAVSVSRSSDRDGVTYLVSVAPNDVGKVIGKNGRVVSAIRYVVGGAAAKARERARVKVVTD